MATLPLCRPLLPHEQPSVYTCASLKLTLKKNKSALIFPHHQLRSHNTDTVWSLRNWNSAASLPTKSVLNYLPVAGDRKQGVSPNACGKAENSFLLMLTNEMGSLTLRLCCWVGVRKPSWCQEGASHSSVVQKYNANTVHGIENLKLEKGGGDKSHHKSMILAKKKKKR